MHYIYALNASIKYDGQPDSRRKYTVTHWTNIIYKGMPLCKFT